MGYKELLKTRTAREQKEMWFTDTTGSGKSMLESPKIPRIKNKNPDRRLPVGILICVFKTSLY